MKVLANYTEVYRIDPDGNQAFYCWFLNLDGIQRQLAWLLLELQGKNWLSFRTIDGRIVDPLKEAESKVTLTGFDSMPRGFIEYDGCVYFGQVREYREIETKDIKA